MRKITKYIISLSLFFIFSVQPFAQVSISGPGCVLPGVTYQYNILGNWTATSTMQICITGGSIIDNGQVSSNRCTANDKPISSVFVTWNASSGGSVKVTSSQGNTSLNVTITSVIQPGTLDQSTVIQNFSDTVSIPSSIRCSKSTGGSCSPIYTYQWQRSFDALKWTDIIGATGQNLSFNYSVKQTTYYRRKVVEKGSGTIGYSDISTVNITSITAIATKCPASKNSVKGKDIIKQELINIFLKRNVIMNQFTTARLCFKREKGLLRKNKEEDFSKI
jgi:hypothetical protein